MLELVQRTGGMFIPPHDHVTNTYSGTNLTQIVYRLGGSTGKVVAIINMTYNVNDNVETVELTK